jgi:hypothetical protein
MGGIAWWDERIFHSWIILDRLADIILTYVGGCIVEIGIGLSTPILANHARNLGIRHYAVDTDKKKCKRASKRPDMKHDNLIVYNGRSLDFITEFDDSPGLVLIDGCHRSDIVIKESIFFIDRMLPGGVIFLHDTYLCKEWVDDHVRHGKYSNTYEARWELEKRKDVWCLTFPYSALGCGLTLVLKKPDYEYTCDDLELAGLSGDWTYLGQEL